MQPIVRLYSILPDEIERFLTHFYGNSNFDKSKLHEKQWQKEYQNPVEIVDIIGAFIENIEDFNISMWISIDSGVFIKVTNDNADELIRYLYERFPY